MCVHFRKRVITQIFGKRNTSNAADGLLLFFPRPVRKCRVAMTVKFDLSGRQAIILHANPITGILPALTAA